MIIVVYMALLAVAFFFLIVRPQRRQMAARQALITSIEVGDEVISAGGIYGTVIALHDSTLDLRIADGVVITLAREAVARRQGDEPPAVGPADDGGAVDDEADD
jgi:preprotein translocase subunit YajC